MANAIRPSIAPDPSRPKKLGRYELEERLGGDDGFETFRARVRGLAGFDRIFAAKCLHRPRSSQINLNDPFIKTARRLASINDPRVARVLDADVIDGVAVAVTEFVHGLDLDRFRECAQFSGVLATGSDETAQKWQKIAAYIGGEVAGGLAVMHGLVPPLAHAGLSPRNIVATARGGIKILDAGLAQASGQASQSSSKRALLYAGADAVEAEPSAQDDMRALGAILFELATGELPARDSASTMARTALDSLWPSMADFIAGLLADDPALRPTAAEAAKILADHWADVPDASMVTEMAALVRNFSAFVADPGVQNTASPVVQETGPDSGQAPGPEPEEPASAEVISFAPPPSAISSPPSDEASTFVESQQQAGFEDDPTVVGPSGSYAAELFQAAPPDVEASEVDEPLLFDGPNEPTSPPSLPQFSLLRRPAGTATLLAYAPPPSQATSSEALNPSDIQSADDLAVAQSEDWAASPELAQPAMSEPIPELADWGAQALAALGDQAGVPIARLVTPPAPAQAATLSEPPPPVSDLGIEEAFAFTPPLSAEEPMLVAEAQPNADEVQPYAEVDLPVTPPPVPVGADPLLEDELVDEAPALDAAAFEDQDLVEEQGIVEEDAAEPRLAHAMTVSQQAPEPYSAARSSAQSALSEVDAETLATATRGKRIAVGVAAFLLVGGAVAGVLSAVGVLGRPHPAVSKAPDVTKVAGSASKPNLPSPPPAPIEEIVPQVAPVAAVASQTKAAPTLPTDKAEEKAAPPARGAALVPAVASAPLATKPVASSSSGSASTVAVSVTSNPAGAAVWINGEERGTTPCTVKLASGTSQLMLVKAGHVSVTSTFEASAGKTVEQTLKAVDPPLTGEARFRAECKTEGKLPIVIDGRETGVFCPYSKLRVEPGVHRIGVLVPATGKVHEKELTLSAGVRSIVFGD